MAREVVFGEKVAREIVFGQAEFRVVVVAGEVVLITRPT